MDYLVDPKENAYFGIKVFFTLAILILIAIMMNAVLSISAEVSISTFAVLLVYVAVIWLMIIFQKIFLIGYLKGNCVLVSENQFPDIHAVYADMASNLGIRNIPPLYILQEGGLLNAFAIRFSRKNYIAVYSDIFELIHDDLDAVKFVLAHELGHVRRNHMAKRFWTFPSSIIPFLTAAYSRACEYTCDNIGKALAPMNSKNGLLVLAAGKRLYKQVNAAQYIHDADANRSFIVRFVGLFMSHPYLPKRLRNIGLD